MVDEETIGNARMDALAAALERSPELFPHSYDIGSDAVSLVRLTRAEFDAASFLDSRVLSPLTPARRVAWKELARAVAETTLLERCHYIFHIGHVGSTLLSRLLGAHGSILALREPAILRTIALVALGDTPQRWNNDEVSHRLSVFLKLWSRTFDPAQAAMIKATSFVSEMAKDILERPANAKALLLYVRPETFLATILAGANAREEAKAAKAARLLRLHKRLGRNIWEASSLSEGEALAMGWAAEMTALTAASESVKGRALWLDFDEFLLAPEEGLRRAFHHFDRSPHEDEIAGIVAGSVMRRYSKSPEHAYSPALRREILDQARAQHADEIAKGLAWLERSAESAPPVRDCLEIAHG